VAEALEATMASPQSNELTQLIAPLPTERSKEVRPHFQPHPSSTSGYGNTIDLFIPVAEALEATMASPQSNELTQLIAPLRRRGVRR